MGCLGLALGVVPLGWGCLGLALGVVWFLLGCLRPKDNTDPKTTKGKQKLERWRFQPLDSTKISTRKQTTVGAAGQIAMRPIRNSAKRMDVHR